MKEQRLPLKFYIYLLLTILTACLIFFLSAQNADESEAVSNTAVLAIRTLLERLFLGWTMDEITFLVRKLAHFMEYLLLGCFLMETVLAYRETSGEALLPGKRTGLLCFAATALYAVSDELHQHFVSGRAAQLRDICIDCAGAFVGLLIALLPAALSLFLRRKKD